MQPEAPNLYRENKIKTTTFVYPAHDNTAIMFESEKKIHWEKVYEEKTPEQVSWTQEYPLISISMIASFQSNKDLPIIDIGGGDSLLVDFLLQEGYSDITVLDISSKALEKAKIRLGQLADKVKWIVSDINTFEPDRKYGIWHDRATFHFLTAKEDIERYANLVSRCVDGYIVMGTFSNNGPEKCSGLQVCRYDKPTLAAIFEPAFVNIESVVQEHVTPMQTVQQFLFCSFSKKRD